MKKIEELIHDQYNKDRSTDTTEQRILDEMEEHASQQVKLFKIELKAFLKANRKLTPQQIVEHFKL